MCTDKIDVLNMSQNSFQSSRENFMSERHVLEPETNCDDQVLKRSQSGRQIKELNYSLKRCHSVAEPVKKLSRRRRRVKPRTLRVPQVPEKIVNIVNILQHENFLEVIDQFFKPTPRKKP